MKKSIIFCLLFTISLSVGAQSDIDLNHHWLNRLDVNPAAIENNEFLDISLFNRNQWVGFDGAPVSQLLTLSGFIEKINSGVGLTVLNDKIGYMRRVNAKALYSYNFTLSEKSMLSLGLSGGVINRWLDQDKIEVDDIVDPELVTYIDEKLSADFDFGAEFVHQLFQVGASVTHLNQLMKSDDDKLSANYNVYTTLKLPVSSRLRIIPGVSFTHRRNINAFELNSMFYWRSSGRGSDRDLFWAGASFKLKVQELALFFGVSITESLKAGYAFEANFARLGKHSYGSHEIMLRYRIKLYDKVKLCSAYDDYERQYRLRKKLKR